MELTPSGKALLENYDKLKEVFDPNSEVSQEELPRFLYDEARKTIKKLEKKYVRLFGVSAYYAQEPPKDPEFQLGWAKAFECGFGKKARVLDMTEKGLEIINRLREIRGLCSVEEAKKRFKERWYGKRA